SRSGITLRAPARAAPTASHSRPPLRRLLLEQDELVFVSAQQLDEILRRGAGALGIDVVHFARSPKEVGAAHNITVKFAEQRSTEARNADGPRPSGRKMRRIGQATTA